MGRRRTTGTSTASGAKSRSGAKAGARAGRRRKGGGKAGEIAPETVGTANPEAEKAVEGGEKTPQRSRGAGRSIPTGFWVGLYLVVFVIFVSVIVFATVVTGGDKRVRTKLFTQIEEYEESERWAKAAEALKEYADRPEFNYDWDNFKFLRRIGRAYLESEQYEEAARTLMKSVDVEAKNNEGTRAQAGAALWALERREEAVAFFREELEKGDANDSLANFYLALHELENGDKAAAFARFQALQNPDEYRDVIDASLKQVQQDVFDPARERARQEVDALLTRVADQRTTATAEAEPETSESDAATTEPKTASE